jgi:hypothetical protein
MRLASYNVENLFDRAKAMSLDDWDKGRPVLEAFAALNALLGDVTYTVTLPPCSASHSRFCQISGQLAGRGVDG